MGAQGPSPGPPQTPRSVEARLVSLEKRVNFLMRAFQEVAFERSERRAEVIEALGEIQKANDDILAELRGRPPLIPPPSP